MKKLLILILSILFLGNVAMGKNKRNSNSSYKLKNKKDVIKNSKYNRGVDTTKYNTFIIEYDFKTGVYNSNNLKPTVGEPVIFKIVNINRLAYEVEIKAKDSVITGDLYIINKLLEEMPSSPLADSSNKKVNVDQELYNQKIVYEKSDFLNESDSVKNIESIHSLEKINKWKSNIRKFMDEKEEVDKLINKARADSIEYYKNTEIERDYFIKQSKELDSAVQIEMQDSIKLINEKRLSYDIKYKEISNIYVDKLHILNTEIGSLSDSVRTMEGTLTKGFDKYSKDNENFILYFNALRESYTQLNKILELYDEILGVTHNCELTQLLYKEKYYKEINEKCSNIDELAKHINQFNEHYVNMMLHYTYMNYNPELDQILNNSGKRKLFSQVDAMKNVAEKMYSVYKTTNYGKLINFIKHNVAMLNDSSAFTISSSPIQPFNDLVFFDISIQKRKGNASELYSERKFTYTEFTQKGIRYDLGIGLAGAFYPKVKTYEIEKNGQVSFKQKSKHSYVPSLVSMFTMSRRRAKYIEYGASLGLGLGYEEGKVQLGNFYGGPSLILGKFQRIVLTAGCSLNNLKVLKPFYNEENEYDDHQLDSNYFTTKYKAGVFMSITYNLTKGVKDNFKVLNGFK